MKTPFRPSPSRPRPMNAKQDAHAAGLAGVLADFSALKTNPAESPELRAAREEVAMLKRRLEAEVARRFAPGPCEIESAMMDFSLPLLARLGEQLATGPKADLQEVFNDAERLAMIERVMLRKLLSGGFAA